MPPHLSRSRWPRIRPDLRTALAAWVITLLCAGLATPAFGQAGGSAVLWTVGSTAAISSGDDPSQVRFHHPTAVALDAAGDLLVADTGNHVIRKITLDGDGTKVSTLAGMPGWFSIPVSAGPRILRGGESNIRTLG